MGDYTSKWSTFQLDWDQDWITMSVDGELYANYDRNATGSERLPYLTEPMFLWLTACVMNRVRPTASDVFPLRCKCKRTLFISGFPCLANLETITIADLIDSVKIYEWSSKRTLPIKTDDGRSPRARITVDNTSPRLDTEGRHLLVADGSLNWFPDESGGRFWLHGATYCPENSEPLQPPGDQPVVLGGAGNGCPSCAWANTTFAAYSSADMSPRSWKLEARNIMPAMDPHGPPKSGFPSSNSTYFDPSVLYNAKTRTFVLWFTVAGTGHTDTAAGSSPFNRRVLGSAVAAHPAGPFVPHWRQWFDAGMQFPTASDSYTWMHESGERAFVKTNLRNQPWGTYTVELSPDFTEMVPSKKSEIVGAEFCSHQDRGDYFLEGGSIFNHGNSSWFMTSGRSGCMDYRGADARLWHSTDPLGPWRYVGEMVRFLNGSTNVSFPHPSRASSATAAQQFGASRIGSTVLYYGVRWHHLAGVPFRAASPPAFVPVHFSDAGMPRPLQYVDRFQMTVPTKTDDRPVLPAKWMGDVRHGLHG